MALGDACELGKRRARSPPGRAVSRRWLRAVSSSSSASTAPNSPSIGRLWPVPQPISRMRASSAVGDPAADQLGEDLAAGAIPPVTLVELRHLVVDDALHQRKTHCRLSAKVTTGVTKSIGTIGAARPSQGA